MYANDIHADSADESDDSQIEHERGDEEGEQ